MNKIIILAFLLMPGLLPAQKTPYVPVNPMRVPIGAFPFLNFAQDARSSALGEAGVATTPSEKSGFVNPAQLLFLQKKDSTIQKLDSLQNQKNVMVDSALYSTYAKNYTYTYSYQNPIMATFNYTQYATNLIEGMRLYSGSVSKLIGRNAYTLQSTYFQSGLVEIRSNKGVLEKTVHAKEYYIGGNYSYQLTDKNSLGIGVKYIYANLAGAGALNGVASKAISSMNVDLFYFHNGRTTNEKRWLNYGASITNIGAKVRYIDYKQRSFQPTRLKVGLAQNFIVGSSERGKENSLMITADANKLLVPTPPIRATDNTIIAGKDEAETSGIGSIYQSWSTAPDGFTEHLKEIYYNIGAEFTFKEFIALRAGYFTQNKAKGNIHYLSLGAGVSVSNFSLDAALIFPNKANEVIAQTFRLQLSYFPLNN